MKQIVFSLIKKKMRPKKQFALVPHIFSVAGAKPECGLPVVIRSTFFPSLYFPDAPGRDYSGNFCSFYEVVYLE